MLVLFFKTVIILVCLSTQKIGYNSLIKKWGNDIITLLAFLLCFSLMSMYIINFLKLKLKPNCIMGSAWYVLFFSDLAFHPTSIHSEFIHPGFEWKVFPLEGLLHRLDPVCMVKQIFLKKNLWVLVNFL